MRFAFVDISFIHYIYSLPQKELNNPLHIEMRRIFGGSYKKIVHSATLSEQFYILPTSSATREGLIQQLSYQLSPSISSVIYQTFPPVLVIQLTKAPEAEVDILLSGLDLSGLAANGDENTCLRYDLYAVCLYNAQLRHYRAVTYSYCLKKWILYESKCVTVLNSFGLANKFRSSEPYVLFYKQQNLAWPTPVIPIPEKTGTTSSYLLRNPSLNTSTELTDSQLSTPITHHLRTSETQSDDASAQNTTLASPFHQRVLPLSVQYSTAKKSTPTRTKVSCNLPPRVLCFH